MSTLRCRIAATIASLTLLVAAVPAAAAPSFQAPPAAVGTTINLQKASLGKLKLGMSPFTARKLLGKPSFNADGNMKWSRYGIRMVVDAGVSVMQFTSPKITLGSTGLGVGDTSSDILAALPQMECGTPTDDQSGQCFIDIGPNLQITVSFSNSTATMIQLDDAT